MGEREQSEWDIKVTSHVDIVYTPIAEQECGDDLTGSGISRINDYEIVKFLGCGSFGDVFKARRNGDAVGGRHFAVKVCI